MHSGVSKPHCMTLPLAGSSAGADYTTSVRRRTAQKCSTLCTSPSSGALSSAQDAPVETPFCPCPNQDSSPINRQHVYGLPKPNTQLSVPCNHQASHTHQSNSGVRGLVTTYTRVQCFTPKKASCMGEHINSNMCPPSIELPFNTGSHFFMDDMSTKNMSEHVHHMLAQQPEARQLSSQNPKIPVTSDHTTSPTSSNSFLSPPPRHQLPCCVLSFSLHPRLIALPHRCFENLQLHRMPTFALPCHWSSPPPSCHHL